MASKEDVTVEVDCQTLLDGDGQADRLECWLAARLREERSVLELRHRELCLAARALTPALPELLAAPRAAHPPAEPPASTPTMVGCFRNVGPANEAGSEVEPSQDTSRLQDCVLGSMTESDSAQLRHRWTSKVGRNSTLGKDVKHMLYGSVSVQKLAGTTHHRSRTRPQKVLQSTPFELIFAGLIILNAVVMALDVQRRGVQLHQTFLVAEGLAEAREVWPGAERVLAVAEVAFGVTFTFELAFKIFALRCRFIGSPWNLLDFLIVAFWLIEAGGASISLINPMLLRLCRLVRILRLARVVRSFEMFDTLMLMMSSIRASFSVFIWSSVLLGLIFILCGMLLNGLLSDFMEDDTVDLAVRRDVYAYFGSFSSSVVTMFEITLGNWVPVCRVLQRNVNEWYGLFFVAYKFTAGFCVLKVITGVFLHETFKCASLDDELMIQTKERSRMKFQTKMAMFFVEADSSGDGMCSREEFVSIMSNSRVRSWMHGLDLCIRDPDALFSYITGTTGSDAVSADELTRAIGQLKGNAQQYDIQMLLHNQQEVHEALRLQGQELASAQAEAALAQADAAKSIDPIKLAVWDLYRDRRSDPPQADLGEVTI